jgi:hypothetical protein
MKNDSERANNSFYGQLIYDYTSFSSPFYSNIADDVYLDESLAIDLVPQTTLPVDDYPEYKNKNSTN